MRWRLRRPRRGIDELIRIVFDPAKDTVNFNKHGLHLSDFRGFDAGTDITIADDRADYGEPRYRTFGRIAGLGYMIAFTLRRDQLRLISFRRAHEKEMKRYGQASAT